MKNLILMEWAEDLTCLINSKFYNKISTSLSDINKDSVILFSGGTDIATSIYGETPSKYHEGPSEPSLRDAHEIKAFNIGQEVGAKNLGICRGSQMLCALSGHKLYQHVSDHGIDHNLVVGKLDGTGFQVLPSNSVHHQAMRLTGEIPHKLIGWAQNGAQYIYNTDKQKLTLGVGIDIPEIVWFENTNSLAIQGHPEYSDAPKKYVEYCKAIIKKYLFS